jgi:hypothetical protein
MYPATATADATADPGFVNKGAGLDVETTAHDDTTEVPAAAEEEEEGETLEQQHQESRTGVVAAAAAVATEDAGSATAGLLQPQEKALLQQAAVQLYCLLGEALAAERKQQQQQRGYMGHGSEVGGSEESQQQQQQQHMGQVLDEGGGQVQQLLEVALPGAEVVWVGSGFAAGGVTRLQLAPQHHQQQQQQLQQEHHNIQQQHQMLQLQLQQQQHPVTGLLWEVPQELQSLLQPSALALLQLAGVGPCYSLASYATALSQLAARYPTDTPLTSADLATAVALAEAAALTVAASAYGGDSGGVRGVVVPLLLLPDEDGVMAVAGEMYFNDAPWLLLPQGGGGWRFVAKDISQQAAASLGVRSLR